ncbi:Uncharacterized protein PBTT_02722 [Plasmodiophora brassicae]
MQYADLDASSGDAGDRATTFTWRKVMIRSAVLLTLGVITLAAILPAVGPPGSHAIQPAETVVVVIGICLLVAAAALPVRVLWKRIESDDGVELGATSHAGIRNGFVLPALNDIRPSAPSPGIRPSAPSPEISPSAPALSPGLHPLSSIDG